jgi:hypothetical protein
VKLLLVEHSSYTRRHGGRVYRNDKQLPQLEPALSNRHDILCNSCIDAFVTSCALQIQGQPGQPHKHFARARCQRCRVYKLLHGQACGFYLQGQDVEERQQVPRYLGKDHAIPRNDWCSASQVCFKLARQGSWWPSAHYAVPFSDLNLELPLVKHKAGATEPLFTGASTSMDGEQ